MYVEHENMTAARSSAPPPATRESFQKKATQVRAKKPLLTRSVGYFWVCELGSSRIDKTCCTHQYVLWVVVLLCWVKCWSVVCCLVSKSE